MVQCLSDRGNYFLLTGLPIAVLVYLSALLSSSLRWLKLLTIILLAQVLYAILAFNAPDTWQVNFGQTMLLTLVVLAAVIYFCIKMTETLVLVTFVLSIGSVFLYQLGHDFATFFRAHIWHAAPTWLGFAVFALLLVSTLVLLYLSRAHTLVVAALVVACSSICLFVLVRLAGIEYGQYGEVRVYEIWEKPEPDFRPPPDALPAPFLGDRFARLGMCCGDGAPKGRCPISLDDDAYDAVLLVLVLFLVVVKCRRCRNSARAKTVAKDSKGKPRKVGVDEEGGMEKTG
jgi:hypothetical protein